MGQRYGSQVRSDRAIRKCSGEQFTEQNQLGSLYQRGGLSSIYIVGNIKSVNII